MKRSLSQTKFWVRFGLLCLACLISLPAWAQTITADHEKYGGTLRIALPFDPSSLDARYLPTQTTQKGFQQIYDRLYDYGPQGEGQLIPSLATGWKKENDKTFLILLRKGVHFHNGREMTADDIKKFYEWLINPPNNWKPLMKRKYATAVERVETVDKYTLRLVLKKANFPFLESEIIFEAIPGVGDTEQITNLKTRFAAHPDGTGPFKFSRWVSGDHIILERNENYWLKKPYLEKVIFRIIPDSQTMILALQKGEIDIATRLSWRVIDILAKDPHVKTYKTYRGDTTLRFNMRRWPMNTIKFRKGVAMAVDWEKVIMASGRGHIKVNRTYLNEIWSPDPKAKELIPSYNPRLAKKLFSEVEADAGKPIPVLYVLGDASDEDMSSILKMADIQLGEFGIKTKLTLLPRSLYKEKRMRDARMEWDITMATTKPGRLDPWYVLRDAMSDYPRAPDGKNEMGYENPKVDQILKKALETFEREERQALYRQVELLVLNDLPELRLYQLPRVDAVRDSVHDYIPHNSRVLFLTTPFNNIWVERR